MNARITDENTPMQLHCLGTAGYHPNEHRHTSGYFLPESGVLLDAGTGTFRLAERIQTPTLDILLSHAHLDHVAGLTFLLDVLYQRPVERLRIWGQAEKLAQIREHLFSRLLFPVQLEAQWCEIDDRESFSIGDGVGDKLGGCKVTWRPQQHPGGSVGFRLDWPDRGSLLYLTDTTGDDSEAATNWYLGADLMMHECYFTADQADWAEKTGHTWTGRVAEIAKLAAPKHLLLTHVNPLSENPEAMRDEVAGMLAEDGISVGLADDLQVIEFGK